MSAVPTKGAPPVSLFRRRLAKFRRLRRGWWSFVLLTGALLLSFLNPVLVTDQAWVVSYEGQLLFPLWSDHIEARELGQRVIGPPRYRLLKAQFEREGSANWVLLAPYPYGPNESLLTELDGSPPHPPTPAHWMGTDDRARDVFARLVYGFRLSMLFGLGVVTLAFLMGTAVGAVLGYFGGWIDILGQRVVEVWSGVPFLYTIIILATFLRPSATVLAVVLASFTWMGISYYVRGEFLREKARDYVAAAVAIGESDASIMFRHILPNALTPVVSFAPFVLVGAIASLVSLDFLGFGVPAPTPSWGELVKQGLATRTAWHLVVFPIGALFTTLIMVVFIGEAVREAFDPKTHARLR